MALHVCTVDAGLLLSRMDRLPRQQHKIHDDETHPCCASSSQTYLGDCGRGGFRALNSSSWETRQWNDMQPGLQYC